VTKNYQCIAALYFCHRYYGSSVFIHIHVVTWLASTNSCTMQ